MEAALWRAEAASRFGRVVALQGGAAGGFALAVGALALAGPGDMLAGSGGVVAGAGDALGAVAASYVGVAALASGVGVALGWSGAGSLPRASRREARAMLGFGRYSVGTLLGTSLLQNADTLLLGWWLGPGAVAVYGVAQKVVRVAQIPLRALAATAFPAMSRLRAQGDRTALLAFAERWTGTFTLAVAPALVLLALFADAAVTLVGGADYPEAAAVVRVFALYLALLPLDRALGLLLDALGRPRANLAKVLAMGLANAALDVGVLAAGGGVVGVAAVTLATMGVGAALGLRFVRRALPFSLGATARAGWRCVTRLRVSGA
jgi:O-antigen/teichoic acid export membrane protein